MFNKNQNGVSLIITFFIMTIILSVVLSISAILYSEVKIIRNVGNSVTAFYAADSGVEKILYYDRVVLPTVKVDPPVTCTNDDECDLSKSQFCVDNFCYQKATRGICSMIPFNVINNPSACPNSVSSPGLPDSSIYCDNITGPTVPPEDSEGCDPAVCNDCKLSFKTNFPGSDPGYSYSVDATVVPAGTFSQLTINSAGFYKDVNRKIELSMFKAGPPVEVITITDARAVPNSADPDHSIDISVHVKATYGVDLTNGVKANIKNDPFGTLIDSIILNHTTEPWDPHEDTYTGTWTGPEGSYWVDIEVLDQKGNSVTQSNI
jgi:hypothetical protein